MRIALIGMTGVLALVGTASCGASTDVPEGVCVSHEDQSRNASNTGVHVGQSVVEALCSLRRLDVGSVELAPDRPAVHIDRIDELDRLGTLKKVTLIFEGKVAGGFTFDNGEVTHSYFNPNPYFLANFAVFKEAKTVAEVIGIAKERMQHLREVKFHEVVLPERIPLDQIDQSAIELAARSPEWRCGGESKKGPWWYIITVADGAVQHIEVHGTPPMTDAR